MRICVRYGATEIDLGVGLNTLANEGSFENSFLSVFEEDFTADVSCRVAFLCVLMALARRCPARPSGCACLGGFRGLPILLP